MRRIALVLSIAACRSTSEAPLNAPMILEPTLVTQDAAVPDGAKDEVADVTSRAPVVRGELRLDVRSIYVDAPAGAILYASELVWAGDRERPFLLYDATAEDWKALHQLLKVRRDEFASGAKAGVYIYPNHAVPDLKASKGKRPNTDLATYDNIHVLDTWRFCFGGHVGTGATMKKCIVDTDAVTATTYDVKTPRAE